MPLFGSSSNDNKHHGHANDLGATGTGVGRTNETYPPSSEMTGPGMGQSGVGQGGMGQGGMADPGAGHHNAEHHTGGMRDDGMMDGAGNGAGMGSLGAGNNAGTGTGTGAGTGVGHANLQAKGLEKEQEAKGLKIQSHEMAEAERLEHEAGIRRERAVAHGAHPDNRHVGGMGPGGAGGATGGGTGAY
ncbi:hypothetical protein DFH06DRAFT_1129897 [Mycena polygramma]|nr:hypothetical protein DFH06DRAFT_1129897 [Mycena polygramma]